jgi:glycosyltransferase involved in cell wall biosynthesis
MNKIKICFYAHTVDYAGTWRSHERIILNLDKNIFDPYIIYREEADNNRLPFIINNFDNNKLISFSAKNHKTGPEQGYSFIETNFYDVLKKYNFDIFHFARGGYYEWPFVKRFCPIQVETNIFGFRDNSEFLDRSISISETINKMRGGTDIMIYNPIPEENPNANDLKKFYNIPEDYFVFGRIGRKDNFHPIALNALKLLKNKGVNFKYIIIGACNFTISKINELDLNNECIIVETTNDDNYIDDFHKTIDVFLHYRSDGETFGTAIAQSMMYGNPVVSHYAGYNAQSEIISDGGYVSNNEIDYCDEIFKLINDKNYYDFRSNNAKIRSKDFEEKVISKKMEKIYINLYNNSKNDN